MRCPCAELPSSFTSDYQLAKEVKRMRSQGASGILVTWYSPWSYTVEVSRQIPFGVVYECLAPETRMLSGAPEAATFCP